MRLIRRLGMVIALAAIVGAAWGLQAGTASADTVDCIARYGGYINVAVNANVVANGATCTIGPNGSVDGNITQTGPGSVIVEGTVNGDIEEDGHGSVVVHNSFNGNIKEKDSGGVRVVLGNGELYDGNIEEEGPGDVSVVVNGTGRFNGNINEKDRGNLTTSGTGHFNGNTKEEGPGSCSNSIANFNGKACE